MKKPYHIFLACLIAIVAASNIFGAAFAVSNSPAQIAESIRSTLVQAQLDLVNDPASSAQLVADAETAYQTGLSAWFAKSDPDAQLRIDSAFEVLNEDVLHLASIVEIGMPVAVVNSLSAAPEVSQKTGPLRPAPEQSAQEPVIAQQMEMITPNHRARDYQTLRREMLHRP